MGFEDTDLLGLQASLRPRPLTHGSPSHCGEILQPSAWHEKLCTLRCLWPLLSQYSVSHLPPTPAPVCRLLALAHLLTSLPIPPMSPSLLWEAFLISSSCTDHIPEYTCTEAPAPKRGNYPSPTLDCELLRAGAQGHSYPMGTQGPAGWTP